MIQRKCKPGVGANIYRADKPRGGTSDERPHGGNTGYGLRGVAYRTVAEEQLRDRAMSTDLSALSGHAPTITRDAFTAEQAKIAALKARREAGERRLPRGLPECLREPARHGVKVGNVSPRTSELDIGRKWTRFQAS